MICDQYIRIYGEMHGSMLPKQFHCSPMGRVFCEPRRIGKSYQARQCRLTYLYVKNHGQLVEEVSTSVIWDDTEPGPMKGAVKGKFSSSDTTSFLEGFLFLFFFSFPVYFFLLLSFVESGE